MIETMIKLLNYKIKMFNKLSNKIILKYLYSVVSLFFLFKLSSCQLAEENFSRLANFTIEHNGKMTFNKKNLDLVSGIFKDDSSYSFILGKLKEFNDQNKVIKESAGLNFTKENKEDVIFMDHNATKLTFKYSFNTSTDNKFYNPKANLFLYVYFFRNLQGLKLNEYTNNKIYISYKLTDYEFCDTDSTLMNCIQTPASENNTALYKIGKYLEFEFDFSSTKKKNYKVFSDLDFGITELGDFLYVIMSEFKQDGEPKLIESKDIKLNNDKAILRFPKFTKSVAITFLINTNYDDKIIDDKPSGLIKYTTNTSVDVSINPEGGVLTFSKEDPDLNNTKSLKISLLSISELDKDGKPLGTFKNIDHFISNITSYNFQTEEFKKDKYKDIEVIRSSFYLKGIPKEDTIIYGDLIIFEKKGNLTLDGYRRTNIKPGDMNLHVEVFNWPFCRHSSFGSAQNCPSQDQNEASEEGSLLEIKFELSGKSMPCHLPYSEDRFTMTDLSYIFTGHTKVDGRIEKMNADIVHNSNVIKAKLPMFSKSASFQIIIDMNKPEGPHTLLIAIIGLVALFSAGFIIFMCISKKIKQSNSDPSLLG